MTCGTFSLLFFFFEMLRFVLVGQQGVGKSSIFSRISPQATSLTKYGSSQTIPIPPALFSVVTIDFPSPNFTLSTPLENIPQVFSTADAIIFVMVDPEDPNLSDLLSLLKKYSLQPKVYVLLHQIDKFDKSEQPELFEKVKENAKNNGISEENCFETSLFDGSISRTIPKIVASLMPKINELEECAQRIHKACQATRVLICDSATFLSVCDTNPNRPELPTAIFEYILHIYPKGKDLKAVTFECNNSVIVYSPINEKAGIFISSASNSVTTTAIQFNIKRALPQLQQLIQ